MRDMDLNNRAIASMGYYVPYAKKNTLIHKINIFLSKDILYIFVFFIAITPMQFSFSKLLIPFAFIYTSIIFFLERKKLSGILIFLSILWLMINIIAFYRSISLNVTSFPYAFYMQFLRLFLAYMIMSILGDEFFFTLEKWLYKLSVLSLPFFLLETLFRPLFYRVSSYLNFATIIDQKILGGWYGGFYTFNAWSAGRNSGFMWEPGGFAFILIFLIIFRFYQNSLKIDKHIIVYFICLATTLSTTGILVGFLLLLTYLVSKSRNVFPILLIPLCIYIFFVQIWELEFIGPKINMYLYNLNLTWQVGVGSAYTLRLNRIGIFYYAIKQSFNYPLGHGVFPVLGYIDEFGEAVSGPNSYATVVVKWGWLGLILFVSGIWNASKKMFNRYNDIVKLLIALSIAMTLFSNTLDNNLIVLCFLLYPFAISNNPLNNTYYSQLS